MRNKNAYVFSGLLILFAIGLVLHLKGILRMRVESFGYTYPYDFFECAKKRCRGSQNHQLHEYLTDQEAFVRLY